MTVHRSFGNSFRSKTMEPYRGSTTSRTVLTSTYTGAPSITTTHHSSLSANPSIAPHTSPLVQPISSPSTVTLAPTTGSQFQPLAAGTRIYGSGLGHTESHFERRVNGQVVDQQHVINGIPTLTTTTLPASGAVGLSTPPVPVVQHMAGSTAFYPAGSLYAGTAGLYTGTVVPTTTVTQRYVNGQLVSERHEVGPSERRLSVHSLRKSSAGSTGADQASPTGGQRRTSQTGGDEASPSGGQRRTSQSGGDQASPSGGQRRTSQSGGDQASPSGGQRRTSRTGGDQASPTGEDRQTSQAEPRGISGASTRSGRKRSASQNSSNSPPTPNSWEGSRSEEDKGNEAASLPHPVENHSTNTFPSFISTLDPFAHSGVAGFLRETHYERRVNGNLVDQRHSEFDSRLPVSIAPTAFQTVLPSPPGIVHEEHHYTKHVDGELVDERREAFDRPA